MKGGWRGFLHGLWLTWMIGRVFKYHGGVHTACRNRWRECREQPDVLFVDAVNQFWALYGEVVQ